MSILPTALLQKHWPHADSAVVNAIVLHADEVFSTYELTTPLRRAHFMGQISVECGNGTVFVENMNYSAQRMCVVWPKRFPTIESAIPYAHHPRELANKVYNGRMGNRPDTDDGWNFRGRGMIQTTGHDGYLRLSTLVSMDLIEHPDLLTEPNNLLPFACAEFVNYNGLLQACDANDYEKVTRLINGGLTDLAARVATTKSWLGDFNRGPIG